MFGQAPGFSLDLIAEKLYKTVGARLVTNQLGDVADTVREMVYVLFAGVLPERFPDNSISPPLERLLSFFTRPARQAQVESPVLIGIDIRDFDAITRQPPLSATSSFGTSPVSSHLVPNTNGSYDP